jgi:hypothetical protein
MKDNQHEQLFTELAPEEAAVIEGGKRIFLKQIECINANMDTPAAWNSDDLYLQFTYANGTKDKVWGTRSMDNGHIINLGNLARTFNGSLKVSLWDEDPGFDDLVDSHYLDATTTGWRTKRFANANGTKYDLTYRVTA